jgi:tetratricopeptide (TPR) repeat protein
MNSPEQTVAGSLEEAWSAIQRHDLNTAESACRMALARDAQNIDALSTLGYVLHASGQFPAAEAVFERLTGIDPAQPAHWMNLATARRCAGNPDEALADYSRAAALGESSANFLFNVGLTHIDRKDFESGRAVLAQAAALEPTDAEIRYYHALCCYERVRTDEALDALRDWESLSGLHESLIADIGLLLMKLGEPRRAEPAIRQALAADPGNPRTRLTLIQLLERTNRIEDASSAMASLQQDPRSRSLGPEFFNVQAQLEQRNGRHEIAIQLFETLLAENKEPQLAHLLQFPIAKSLDAVGRYSEAYDMLQRAHASQALLLRMTAPLASARGAPSMTITRFGVDPADVGAWKDREAPAMEDSPVFIVAFPRSGTTLLELTLDGHPALESMDEQPFVQNALDDMLAWGIGYPEALAALSDAQLQDLRARYWQRSLRKASLLRGQRLVDKNPLNILRLPAIKRLFPNAPIILAIRHPFDVLLSCFMQHFRTPDFALLCQDLPTLASGYRHTFDFWYRQHALLQPRSMELRYETFVADFENQVRGILNFLNLPWDDALMQPQKNAQSRGFISTPSYSQVVEPVNRKAVDRWRNYEAQFGTVLPTIKPYLERWDYRT